MGREVCLLLLTIPYRAYRKNRGVLGHFDHPLDRPWKNIDSLVIPGLATVVGAKRSEVACMGSLTSNIHTLLSSFYRPTKERYKILYEEKAFPSDIVSLILYLTCIV